MFNKEDVDGGPDNPQQEGEEMLTKRISGRQIGGKARENGEASKESLCEARLLQRQKKRYIEE